MNPISVARIRATASDPGPAWLSVGSLPSLPTLSQGTIEVGHRVSRSMTPRLAVHFCSVQVGMLCIFRDLAAWGTSWRLVGIGQHDGPAGEEATV